jgi:hypothetical protein
MSHVAGTICPSQRKNTGIESAEKTYPDRKTAGKIVPIAICMAASRVLARVEINKPVPSIVSTNGKVNVRSVTNEP